MKNLFLFCIEGDFFVQKKIAGSKQKNSEKHRIYKEKAG